MEDFTADLAQSITRLGSKQTYYTARIMVDKDLVSDFCRAYAYFRWVDDIVDVESQSDDERITFIKKQRELIDRLYEGELPAVLAPEEQILATLISHDQGKNSGLNSYIHNMFDIIEFDALRKGQLISRDELTWYIDRLGLSVTDGLQYFIANWHPYPDNNQRYLAAKAAHITHLLRDMSQDISNGFINIPREDLETHRISPENVDSIPFRNWVQERISLAREYFREGKLYLDELDILRCKIVGYWYCTRFEVILDKIEDDGYILRSTYNEHHKGSAWVRFAWIGISVSMRHVYQRIWQRTYSLNARNRTSQ